MSEGMAKAENRSGRERAEEVEEKVITYGGISF